MTATKPFLFKSDAYLERIGKGGYEARLLAQGDRADIIKQFLPANTTFYLDSAQEWEGFEFIYILEGRLSYLGTDPPTVLEAGDYIARHNIGERSWFKTETNVILLSMSSEPSFHIMREETQEFYELARAVEVDEYMDGHCKRLEKMAGQVGERLGLSGERMGHLNYAAFFHDIGKAKIPREILQKPGKLTPQEWELIKRHATWGREMLATKDFLKEAAQIVEQTHERPDGKGYPKGLKDDEISLEAKIIAVVDAYDAMTTDRPYRKALSQEEALEELKRNAGTQFDPQVVEAFLEVLREHGTPRDGHRSWFDQELARLKQREAFLRISEEILAGRDLQQTLNDIVTTITQHTPFRRAALALYDRPISPQSVEEVKISHVACAGLSPQEEERLKSHPLPPKERKKIFQEEFALSRSYYIPHDRLPWREHPGLIKSHSQPSGNWHPEDFLFIPMWVKDGQLIGLISVDDPLDGRAPTLETLEPIEMFANLAAIAVAETQRRDQLQEAVDQLSHLNRFLSSVNEAKGLDELLELILQQAVALLTPKADSAIIILRDEKTGEFRFRAAMNRDLEALREVKLGEGDLSEAVRHAREPLLIASVSSDQSPMLCRVEEATGQPFPKSAVVVPIRDRDQDLLIAVMGIGCRAKAGAFTQEDAEKLGDLVPEIELALSRVRDRERLRELSIRDPLTQVYNRRYLAELIEREGARARRYGFPISLIMIDFDDFHEINDRFGHLEGDRVLKEAAALFEGSVREVDVVIRYGGDEFAIVMPETPYRQAQEVAKRLRGRLAEKDFGLACEVSIKTGVATWEPRNSQSFEEVLEEADRWIYCRNPKRKK